MGDIENRGRDDSPVAINGWNEDVDIAAIAAAVRDLLIAIGEDPDRAGLRDTPDRVARFYREFLNRDVERFTSFDNNDAGYHGIISQCHLSFVSLCEHHMLPFRGKVHIAYRPDKRIVGLSKLGRVVDLVAGRLQVQEQIPDQIADLLQHYLKPLGVAVLVEAEHSCMSDRGVKKAGHVTKTSVYRGCFANDPEQRQEVNESLRG